MTIPWQELDHIRNFLRLEFLFSGLEVSSTIVIVARFFVFILLCGGLLWAAVKIVLKALECLQTFLASLSSLPATFFLLLILVVPLSSESLGSRWTGYLLLVLALFALAATGVVLVVLWKYGVDQALRFINTVRRRPDETLRSMQEPVLSPDHAVRDLT